MAAARACLMGLLVALTTTGCGSSGCHPGEDPCDTDLLACQDPEEFVYLDDCPLDLPPLELTVGHGELGFYPLGPDSGSEDGGPFWYYGNQGGQHSFLATRIGGAALELYDRVRITLWMAQGPDCSATTPEGKIPDSCSRSLGIRQLVVGPEPALVAVDGLIELYGILLFLDSGEVGMQTVVAAEIEDPCGRTVIDTFTYTFNQ